MACSLWYLLHSQGLTLPSLLFCSLRITVCSSAHARKSEGLGSTPKSCFLPQQDLLPGIRWVFPAFCWNGVPTSAKVSSVNTVTVASQGPRCLPVRLPLLPEEGNHTTTGSGGGLTVELNSPNQHSTYHHPTPSSHALGSSPPQRRQVFFFIFALWRCKMLHRNLHGTLFAFARLFFTWVILFEAFPCVFEHDSVTYMFWKTCRPTSPV